MCGIMPGCHVDSERAFAGAVTARKLHCHVHVCIKMDSRFDSKYTEMHNEIVHSYLPKTSSDRKVVLCSWWASAPTSAGFAVPETACIESRNEHRKDAAIVSFSDKLFLSVHAKTHMCESIAIAQ